MIGGEEDIYTPSGFLNQEAIESGLVSISRSQQPKDSYTAGNKIYAGYILADIYPVEALLVNVGVRYESSKLWVNYAEDGGKLQRRDLNSNDLFPAMNLRYQLDKRNSFRFSFSRTVTRPSFIEMAPFLYQESYGSAQIRGNADLKNGYNYNLDLRYEFFGENGDMCIYGKGDLTDTFSIYEDGIYKTNPQVLRFEKAELVSFENGEITIKINNMYFVDWTDGNYVSSDSFFTYKKD